MAHKIPELKGANLMWRGAYYVHFEWLETYTEICFEIGSRLSSNQLENNKGRMALHTLAFDLTNEFEKLHEGRQWDGEWLDTIESFLTEKLK